MKENNKSSVKALKKQLGAAVAMVCVAAVALGSSTYAWFVSNNTVDATTSTISAQSNAAFMYIRNEDTASTDLRSDVSNLDDTNTELYPAHWAFTSGDATYKEFGKFYKATAQEASASTRDDSSVILIQGNSGEADGSVEAAVSHQYAVKNTFKIGSKGNELTNLIVDPDNGGISLVSGETSNDTFDNALRILVTCGSNWVLCDKNSILGSNNSNILADKVTSAEVTVDIYVFYDGDDTEIYTNNLGSLKDASKKIKVTFSATE